jgi:hypothetical protein
MLSYNISSGFVMHICPLSLGLRHEDNACLGTAFPMAANHVDLFKIKVNMTSSRVCDTHVQDKIENCVMPFSIAIILL